MCEYLHLIFFYWRESLISSQVFRAVKASDIFDISDISDILGGVF